MIDNIYSRVWLSFIYATIHFDNSLSLLIFNTFELVINTFFSFLKNEKERLLLCRIESYFLSTLKSSIQYNYNRCDEVLMMMKI